MNNDSSNQWSRREFTKKLALSAAALALGAQATPASPQPPAIGSRKRPNILLLMSDQERGWLDLPAGLGLSAHEKLLEHGTGFNNFNMHTTPCSPSRATLYTGLHTQITRMTSNLNSPPFPSLEAGVPTIGTLLREQGYYSAYKGKWHLSNVPTESSVRYGHFKSARDALEPFGFSDYSNNGIADGATWAGYKFDGQTASEASLWLQEQATKLDQPWFLAVNFVNPHDIVFFDDVDRQQDRTRADRDFLSPLSPPPTDGLYRQQWDVALPRSYREDDLSTKPWAHQSYVDFCTMMYGQIDRSDEERWRHYQSYYFNCIRDVDAHALTVLQTLEKLGLDDNTIVVYTADHGDMLAAHGMRQKGPTMYKENVRVPLIIRHPEWKGGTTTDALGGAIDLVPTLLSFAGVTDAQRAERYPALKGVDLTPAIASAGARTARDDRGVLYDYNTTLYIDPEATERIVRNHEDATWWSVFKADIAEGRLHPNLNNPGLFRGVHEGRYKFARYFKPSEHHIPKDWSTLLAHNQLELYDTHADPDEITNLGHEPEKHKDVILALNDKVNKLIMEEIGFDDGREHPGPDFLYRL